MFSCKLGTFKQQFSAFEAKMIDFCPNKSRHFDYFGVWGLGQVLVGRWQQGGHSQDRGDPKADPGRSGGSVQPKRSEGHRHYKWGRHVHLPNEESNRPFEVQPHDELGKVAVLSVTSDSFEGIGCEVAQIQLNIKIAIISTYFIGYQVKLLYMVPYKVTL